MVERSFGDPAGEMLVPDPVRAGYPETGATAQRKWYDLLVDRHDLTLVLVGAILGCTVTVMFMVGVFLLAKFGG